MSDKFTHGGIQKLIDLIKDEYSQNPTLMPYAKAAEFEYGILQNGINTVKVPPGKIRVLTEKVPSICGANVFYPDGMPIPGVEKVEFIIDPNLKGSKSILVLTLCEFEVNVEDMFTQAHKIKITEVNE